MTLYHDTDIDEWTVNESSLVPTDCADAAGLGAVEGSTAAH